MRLRFPGTIELDALPAVEDGSAEPVSSWAQVLRVGKFQVTPERELDITTEMLDQMVANSHSYNEAPFDFDHLGTSGKGKAGDGKAAGWAKKWERRGDKLYAFVEWTAEAADLIRKKAYRYVSATFLPKFFDPEAKRDVGARLLGAAITNYPFVSGMDPLSFAEIADISLTDREQRISAAWERRFNPMGDFGSGYIAHFYDDYVLVKKDGKVWKQPFSFDETLGVDFPSEAVEVILTPQELSTMSTITPEQFATLTAQVTELSTGFTAAKTQIAELSAGRIKDQETIAKLEIDLEAAKQLGVKNEAISTVDGLITAGKLLPKQRAWALSYYESNKEQFLAFSATLVPLLRLDAAQGEDGPVAVAGSAKRKDGRLQNTDKSVVQFSQKIEEYRKEHPKVSVAEAMGIVGDENPEMYRAYRESFGAIDDDASVQ